MTTTELARTIRQADERREPIVHLVADLRQRLAGASRADLLDWARELEIYLPRRTKGESVRLILRWATICSIARAEIEY